MTEDQTGIIANSGFLEIYLPELKIPLSVEKGIYFGQVDNSVIKEITQNGLNKDAKDVSKISNAEEVTERFIELILELSSNNPQNMKILQNINVLFLYLDIFTPKDNFISFLVSCLKNAEIKPIYDVLESLQRLSSKRTPPKHKKKGTALTDILNYCIGKKIFDLDDERQKLLNELAIK